MNHLGIYTALLNCDTEQLQTFLEADHNIFLETDHTNSLAYYAHKGKSTKFRDMYFFYAADADDINCRT